MVDIVQHWRFYDWFQNRNVIEEWRISDLSLSGRLEMDAALKDVAKTKNHLEWGARDLKGAPKKEKIFEIKFIADKKQYRLAYIFETNQRVILLIGFYHKQNVYYPPNAVNTARKRAAAYRDDTASAVERKIRFDI